MVCVSRCTFFDLPWLIERVFHCICSRTTRKYNVHRFVRQLSLWDLIVTYRTRSSITYNQIPLDKTEQSLRSREQSGSGIYATQSMITTGGLGCASISSGLNVTAISTASTNSLAINTSSGSKPSAVSSTLLVTATPTGTPTVPHPRHLGSGVFPSPVQNVESQITNHKPVEEIAVTTGPSSTMFSEANLQVSGPSAPTISTMVTGITNTTPQTLVTSNLISSNAPNYQIASLMLDPEWVRSADRIVFTPNGIFCFCFICFLRIFSSAISSTPCL